MTIPAELLIKKANETLGLNVCLYTAAGDPVTSLGGTPPITGTASTDDTPMLAWDGSLYPCLTIDTSYLSGEVRIEVSADNSNWGQLTTMAFSSGGSFSPGGTLDPGGWWTASVYGWRYARIINTGAGAGETLYYCLVPYFLFSSGVQFIRKVNGTVINPATQETLQSIFLKIESIDAKLSPNPLDRFVMQDRDGAGYTGYLSEASEWMIEYDDGSSRRFANQLINPGVVDYKTAVTGAWAVRSTLTYGYIDEVI